MNVVLTLIHQYYDVPKGVMHYIIHMVRPRAPPRPEWKSWSIYNTVKVWYEWRSLNWGGLITIRNTDVINSYTVTAHCNYCCTEVSTPGTFIENISTCNECKNLK